MVAEDKAWIRKCFKDASVVNILSILHHALSSSEFPYCSHNSYDVTVYSRFLKIGST